MSQGLLGLSAPLGSGFSFWPERLGHPRGADELGFRLDRSPREVVGVQAPNPGGGGNSRTPTIPAPRGTGVSVTRWSPKPQRQVRFLGPPLSKYGSKARKLRTFGALEPSVTVTLRSVCGHRPASRWHHPQIFDPCAGPLRDQLGAVCSAWMTGYGTTGVRGQSGPRRRLRIPAPARLRGTVLPGLAGQNAASFPGRISAR
jgi:hypothetical protein